jgi:hypothetical protein
VREHAQDAAAALLLEEPGGRDLHLVVSTRTEASCGSFSSVISVSLFCRNCWMLAVARRLSITDCALAWYFWSLETFAKRMLPAH